MLFIFPLHCIIETLNVKSFMVESSVGKYNLTGCFHTIIPKLKKALLSELIPSKFPAIFVVGINHAWKRWNREENIPNETHINSFLINKYHVRSILFYIMLDWEITWNFEIVLLWTCVHYRFSSFFTRFLD